MSLKDDVKKVQQKVEVIEQESFAMSILSDYKKQNKRLYIIILVILTMWFATIGYLVYILNDIGVDETVETYDINQETGDNGNNNFIKGDNNKVNN